MSDLKSHAHYDQLISDIGTLLEKGRRAAARSINTLLVETYWHIGRQIVEYEQKGAEKAEYGSLLLKRLAKDLKARYGKGFSRSNLQYMRLLYLKYPKCQTLSGKLSWSHYTELLSISDDLARSFYEQQCIRENWSVRELKRQRNSALFERLALSKDKKQVLKLAAEGHQVASAEDLLKDPYIFEFLDIPENTALSETELEAELLNKLSQFILELGKGFAYIGRQFRITLGNKHFRVDLVFYHRILKCFVLIDLKIGTANHHDIGQMNMYLNYFKEEENMPDDNPPIGMVLAADKEEVLVEYATGSISNKLFVAKYQLHLPDKKTLENELRFLLSEKTR